jgi:alpha-beta hydrolase superfamily lysophospholipase
MTQLAKPCLIPEGAEILTLSENESSPKSSSLHPEMFICHQGTLGVGASGQPVSVLYWAEAKQDGQDIISFLTESEPKENQTSQPILLLVHGLSGTTQWLEDLAQQFSQSGIKVIGIELPEIGLHESGLGDFTDRQVLIQRVSEMVSSLHSLTGQPIWMLGLSLGGLLAAHAAARKPEGLSGLCLIAPAFKASPVTFEPSFYLEAVMRRLGECLGLQQQGHPMPIPFAKDQTTITRVPEHVTIMQETPNRVLSLTPRAAVQLIKLTLMDTPKVIPKITCPVRLYVSQSDAICDAPTMVDQFARLGSTDKQLVVFPEARHDLTLEPEMLLLVQHFLKSMGLGAENTTSMPSPVIKT